MIRSLLLRLYWAAKLLANDSFVVILKKDAMAHIRIKQPLLFEDALGVESQYATLKEFQEQFAEALQQFETQAKTVNETVRKGGKPKATKKSTR